MCPAMCQQLTGMSHFDFRGGKRIVDADKSSPLVLGQWLEPVP